MRIPEIYRRLIYRRIRAQCQWCYLELALVAAFGDKRSRPEAFVSEFLLYGIQSGVQLALL